MTERSVKSNKTHGIFMMIPVMMILLIVTPVAADSVLNNWTEATSSAAFSPRSAHSSVLYDGKMWVIGGSAYTNDVWYSTDGVTWTEATSSAAFSGRITQCVVYDGKMWVIGGTDRGNCNDVWYSTDGATWTQATAGAAWSARYYHQCVVYDDKMWVLGGYAGGDVNDVWYSTDGVTWTEATSSAAWSARCAHQAIVYDDKMWILGGTSGGNDVWYSTDGVTWTQATAGAAWPSRFYHQCEVYDDKMWVLGGYDGGNLNDVWYSTDGATWTQAGTSTVFSERQHPTSVVHNGRMWIIAGHDGSPQNDVWYTTVGDTSSTVSIGNAGVDHPGDETTVVLTMDSVSNGLSGYNLEVSLENSSIAEFTGVIFPEWADDLNDHGTLPSSQNLLIKASDVGYLVEPGESNITLATLTVKGLYPGISGMTISNTNFDDDDGNDIGISVVTGNFTVTGFSAPVVTNITPCESTSQGVVNVTITGSNFMDGGSVILRNANFINISGNDFTFVSGSEIGCSFNLTGATPGNWSVIVTNIDGQSGVLENGFLVSVVLVPIEGQSEMPTDPNSDGLYEDLNGNLEIDYADVNLFFDKLDWMRANEPVSAFDFVSNGELGIGDIIALFDMIS